jgi:hypothetical protein
MASVNSTERKVLKLLQRAVKSDPITVDEVMSLTRFDLSPAAMSAWLILCQWLSDAELRSRDPACSDLQLQILRAEIENLGGTIPGRGRLLAPARRLRDALGPPLQIVRQGLAGAARGAAAAPARLARAPRNLLAP